MTDFRIRCQRSSLIEILFKYSIYDCFRRHLDQLIFENRRIQLFFAFQEARHRSTKSIKASSGIRLRSRFYEQSSSSSCIRDTVCSSIRLRISDLDRPPCIPLSLPCPPPPFHSDHYVNDPGQIQEEEARLREAHPHASSLNFLIPFVTMANSPHVEKRFLLPLLN